MKIFLVEFQSIYNMECEEPLILILEIQKKTAGHWPSKPKSRDTLIQFHQLES